MPQDGAVDAPLVHGDSGPPGSLSVAFTQAIDDAMFANPTVYATIPVRLRVGGIPSGVSVTFEGASIPARDEGGGLWVADVTISTLIDGVYPIQGRVYAGETTITADAELVIGRTGRQMTDFDEVGGASSMNLHRVNGALYWSWIDARDSERKDAYLQRIDGAGRAMGEPVRLVGGVEETFNVKIAFGATSIGVLYQQRGRPFSIYFKIVDWTGAELLAPINLAPASWHAASGFDIAFDGEAFVLVYRVQTLPSTMREVHLSRVVEATRARTGPFTIATRGDGDPDGNFLDVAYFLEVEVIGGRYVVSFTRERDYGGLDDIPRAQVAIVDHAGTVVSTSFMWESSSALYFDEEAHLTTVGADVVALWTTSDLDDGADPPQQIRASKLRPDGTLDPARGLGTLLMQAPTQRAEPTLIAHDGSYGVLAWLDHRAYFPDPSLGHVDLYVASVGADLTLEPHIIFPQARFVSSLANLNGVAAGANVLLMWADHREDDPPLIPVQAWMETAWF